MFRMTSGCAVALVTLICSQPAGAAPSAAAEAARARFAELQARMKTGIAAPTRIAARGHRRRRGRGGPATPRRQPGGADLEVAGAARGGRLRERERLPRRCRQSRHFERRARGERDGRRDAAREWRERPHSAERAWRRRGHAGAQIRAPRHGDHARRSRDDAGRPRHAQRHRTQADSASAASASASAPCPTATTAWRVRSRRAGRSRPPRRHGERRPAARRDRAQGPLGRAEPGLHGRGPRPHAAHARRRAGRVLRVLYRLRERR